MILNKNGYPQELVNKTINLHLNSLNKIKPVGPEKCLIPLVLPYVNKNSGVLEREICKLVSRTYHSAKPILIFTSKPMFRPGGKDPLAEFKQSMVVYKFNCFCEASYVGMTSRQFGKRIKEHIPKSIDEFCKSNEKTKSIRVINASKRFAISEHLVNNLDCASNYNLKRFKIVKNCFHISDLIKLEAICILLRKPKLCKHKHFNYIVSLIS